MGIIRWFALDADPSVTISSLFLWIDINPQIIIVLVDFRRRVGIGLGRMHCVISGKYSGSPGSFLVQFVIDLSLRAGIARHTPSLPSPPRSRHMKLMNFSAPRNVLRVLRDAHGIDKRVGALLPERRMRGVGIFIDHGDSIAVVIVRCSHRFPHSAAFRESGPSRCPDTPACKRWRSRLPAGSSSLICGIGEQSKIHQRNAERVARLLNMAVRFIYIVPGFPAVRPISALSTYLVLYTMPTTPQV